MDKYFFSVIVPTYNRAAFLPKTLASVLAQTYPHFEVIVVDDGSTDGTRDIITQYQDPRIRYHYKINEERGKARNTGMDLAKGDYITFLDSDDLLYPQHLAHAAEKLKDFSSPHFYRQAYEVRNEDGSLVTKMNKVQGDANEFILQGNYFSCIGIFLKKEVTLYTRFSDDRHLSPSEDWEYWLRLSVRYPIYYDNTITACLINHKQRSVNHFNERHSMLVISKFIQGLKNDPLFMEKRGHYLNKIKAQMYTLLCLNKVIAKQNNGVMPILFHAYRLSLPELFRRRTLAIGKIYLKNIFSN